jgi:hypothetical protein
MLTNHAHEGRTNMKSASGVVITAGLFAGLAAVLTASWSGSSPNRAALAAEAPNEAGAAAGAAAGAPVEPDMHEFMEYVFQPTYLRLKSQMAADPADNAAWKAIKADALTLAEGGNLLLIRQPEDDRADWARHSVQVRDAGGQLYRAAQAKDAQSTRKHYQAMLTRCNACHKQFAGGEYQLEP